MNPTDEGLLALRQAAAWANDAITRQSKCIQDCIGAVAFANAVITRLTAALAKRKAECKSLERLTTAIRQHRDQRAEDRCIEDDDRLYEVLGDDIKCDRRVGDKAAMLANCERFIERRCQGGGPWKSYQQVTEECEYLHSVLRKHGIEY